MTMTIWSLYRKEKSKEYISFLGHLHGVLASMKLSVLVCLALQTDASGMVTNERFSG